MFHTYSINSSFPNLDDRLHNRSDVSNIPSPFTVNEVNMRFIQITAMIRAGSSSSMIGHNQTHAPNYCNGSQLKNPNTSDAIFTLNFWKFGLWFAFSKNRTCPKNQDFCVFAKNEQSWKSDFSLKFATYARTDFKLTTVFDLLFLKWNFRFH